MAYSPQRSWKQSQDFSRAWDRSLLTRHHQQHCWPGQTIAATGHKLFLPTSASDDFSPSWGNLSANSSLNTFCYVDISDFPTKRRRLEVTWLASTTGWGASETRWSAAILSKMLTNSSLNSSLVFWVATTPDFSCKAFALPARTQNPSPCSNSVWNTK